MVSFWPWRGDGSSPASFEKALSTLAARIATTQSQLDRTRSSARRAKVLWMLYLSFAYLVYAIVQILVVGRSNMGAWEWTGMAGGPVLIYITRTVLTAYFSFRTDSLSARLKEQQSERARTIQKLKDATRYDSTQELLNKYGESGRGEGDGKEVGAGAHGGGGGGKQNAKQQQQQRGHGHDGSNQSTTPQRTQMVPPPTANIQRSPGAGAAVSSSSPSSHAARSHAQHHGSPRGQTLSPSAEFAPNAYNDDDDDNTPPTQQHAHNRRSRAESTSSSSSSHWYDRVLDLLLGEDEAAAKNRIVLICSSCRLVNGQAPPGTRTLSEVGSWRCMGCGEKNGELDEGKRIVQEVLGQKGKGGEADGEDGEGEGEGEDEEGVGRGSRVGSGDTDAGAGVKRRAGKKGEKSGSP